jgi:hypothetical protein
MTTTDYAKIFNDVRDEGERVESNRDEFSSYLRTQATTDGSEFEAEYIRSENRTQRRLWKFDGADWSLVWDDTTFN